MAKAVVSILVCSLIQQITRKSKHLVNQKLIRSSTELTFQSTSRIGARQGRLPMPTLSGTYGQYPQNWAENRLPQPPEQGTAICWGHHQQRTSLHLHARTQSEWCCRGEIAF